MQLNDAIKKRRSVTRYLKKKPDWRKVVRSIDATRYAPNADNLFAMKFILISNEETINKFFDATQQDFVSKAKYLVVAVSDDTKLVAHYKERGARYSALQAGAAIQNFLLELTEQGLVTKWVKYFYDEKVKEILGIPEHLIVEGLFPIGLETKIKTGAEVLTALENIVFFEKWGEKNMDPNPRVTLEHS